MDAAQQPMKLFVYFTVCASLVRRIAVNGINQLVADHHLRHEFFSGSSGTLVARA
jgi:hypothetical protein